MGQNVNYLLGNQQTMLGADPELYRQQLLQQEQQRIAALPAQNQLGAQLGTLLGRGLVNVAQDRGFFEVTNPVLQRLTTIQSVYNNAMQAADPNDPLSFYKELQTRFSEAGLGQQAMMAAQELRKFEGENLKTEAARNQIYRDNPALLDDAIAKARDRGDDPLANRLAKQRGQIQIDIDNKRQKDALDLAVKQSNIRVNEAQIARYKADIDAGKVQIVQTPANPLTNTPATISVFRNGKLEETVKLVSDFPAAPSAAPAAAPRASSLATEGFKLLETQ